MNLHYENDGFIAHTTGDCKLILIEGPDLDCEIVVDYDDVNHDEVQKSVRRLVDLLAEHWLQ